MRYMTYDYFHPNFLRLTLLSLLVSLSAPESAVSSNALGLGAPLAQTAQPTSVPWSLDHFLASTDAMETFLVNVSGTAIKIASSSGSDQSSRNKQTPQNDERSWSTNQFVAHSERIDDIRMGLHDRAASKAHQQALFAQMDTILTCLQLDAHILV
jgi:hypothetical protein